MDGYCNGPEEESLISLYEKPIVCFWWLDRIGLPILSALWSLRHRLYFQRSRKQKSGGKREFLEENGSSQFTGQLRSSLDAILNSGCNLLIYPGLIIQVRDWKGAMGRARSEGAGPPYSHSPNHLVVLSLHGLIVGTVLPSWPLQANCPVGGRVRAW